MSFSPAGQEPQLLARLSVLTDSSLILWPSAGRVGQRTAMGSLQLCRQTLGDLKVTKKQTEQTKREKSSLTLLVHSEDTSCVVSFMGYLLMLQIGNYECRT
jgi:hypothetical protein